jgi:hypothetical protein
MSKIRHLAGRLIPFLLCFSVLPAFGSGTASLLFRGGGIRNASTTALAVLAWDADSVFFLRQISYSVLASATMSLILALLSLLAWRQADGHTFLRSGRVAVLVWLAAAVSFPGIAGWLPVLRNSPWTLCVLLLLIAASLAYAWPGVRAGWREWLFAAVTLTGLLCPFRFSSASLRQLAHRPFTAQDVFILGFDSVTKTDTLDLLERFQPSQGSKRIYTNAQTPYPATSVAWRSIFSGQYPPIEAGLPNFRWGSNLTGWLPTELHSIGYDVTIAQDLPASNWFTLSEGVRATGPQGWKAELQSYVWTATFPLSNVGAAWWVGAFGGPTSLSNRLAHCSQCFIVDSLEEIARSAAKGPVMGAIHTGLVHGPNQLTLQEAIRAPGWWHLPATFFLGRAEWSADSRSRATRMHTVRTVLESTLELLDREDVLGHATVFVLADHGPRGNDVPPQTTNNVMFAVFSPDGSGSTTVTTPVSLVDIAPTIRGLVSLPEATTDGHVLPRSDSEGDPQRIVLTDKQSSVQDILKLMGLGKEAFDAKELSQLGRLVSDGTYEYNPEVLSRILSPSAEHGYPAGGASQERQ